MSQIENGKESQENHDRRFFTQHVCLLMQFVLQLISSQNQNQTTNNNYNNGTSDKLQVSTDKLDQCARAIESIFGELASVSQILTLLKKKVDKHLNQNDEDSIPYILRTQYSQIQAMQSNIESAISTNGTYIWRLENVSIRTIEAAKITSPPFYSDTFGYKMRLKVYMNGDSQAEGACLSVFFVLCRGKYDNILQFPFRHKVTLSLLDQRGNHNIVESFFGDPQSSSFKKPESDTNLASGIPNFAPLNALRNGGNYVVDDVMFVKCVVGTVLNN